MREIKISALSVGDWVRYDRGTDAVQIMGIYVRNNQESIVMSDSYYPDGVIGFVEHIKPIPLTPEILEKNGFEAPKAKVWNDSWYWSNRKDVALELRESFGLWYMEIVTKEQRSGLQSNRKLGIGLKDVHQLQHALRLAGVEKEIEV